MVLACFFYLTNYPRLRNRIRDIPSTLRGDATVEEAERFNSAKIALRLRYITTAVWSAIVGMDSSSDVAIYNSRAHGFLPKAPIKKGNVLETLAPLWIARYPATGFDDDSQSQRSLAESFSSESLESFTSLNDFIVSSPVEIIQTIKEIDNLFSKGSVSENWDVIWEKLHVLKGDLLTLQVGSKVIAAVGMINSFREAHSNEEVLQRWHLFRESISDWFPNIK